MTIKRCKEMIAHFKGLLSISWLWLHDREECERHIVRYEKKLKELQWLE